MPTHGCALREPWNCWEWPGTPEAAGFSGEDGAMRVGGSLGPHSPLCDWRSLFLSLRLLHASHSPPSLQRLLQMGPWPMDTVLGLWPWCLGTMLCLLSSGRWQGRGVGCRAHNSKSNFFFSSHGLKKQSPLKSESSSWAAGRARRGDEAWDGLGRPGGGHSSSGPPRGGCGGHQAEKMDGDGAAAAAPQLRALTAWLLQDVSREGNVCHEVTRPGVTATLCRGR